MRLREFWRRLQFFVRRDCATVELEEEMRLHRELRAQALERDGAAPLVAAITARRHFGRPDHHREASRQMWGFGSIDDLRQDLRFAVRRLRRRPGFTLSVVAVLALGIGATTAMFSAVDAAILRPLPFAHPDELLTLRAVHIPFDPGQIAVPPSPVHVLDFTDVAAMHDLFSHVAAYASGGLNLSDPQHPLRVNVGVVTSEFFTTLGIAPIRGRGFDAAEGVPHGPAAAVLSYALWQGQFGGREILNQTILLNDKAYAVVGVMPRGFSFPDASDLWVPMSMPLTFETYAPFQGFLPSHVIARAAPGVTPAFAAAQLRARWQRTFDAARPEPGKRYPAAEQARKQVLGRDGPTSSLQQTLLGDRRTALLVLLGATALLLLIACANATNLLLSQSALRHREIAVREVLGASRFRMIRQLLTESLLLSASGAAVGLVLAPITLAAVNALLPPDLVGVAPATLDLRLLGFAALLALVTGIGFGLWPAFGSTGRASSETIKAGSGHGATAADAGRLRRLMVGAELALTVTLLVGAGLMLRSFQRLMHTDRGMDVARTGSLEMSLANVKNWQGGGLEKLHAILAKLEATPGIQAAGIVNDLPLGVTGGISLRLTIDGEPATLPHQDPPMGRYIISSASYFSALGIPFIMGRPFAEGGGTGTHREAVISRTLMKYWHGANPVGRTFHMPGDSDAVTVVGVVADVRELSLEDDPLPQMYLSIDDEASTHPAFVARGTLPPAALLGAMQAAVRVVDPSQAVFHLRMMDDVVRSAVAPRRTNTLLIALFAALAFGLASLGVYAVVAQGVALRAREFGIRAALGASGHDLVALVSREMVVVAATGIATGLAGAWVLSRVAASLLYGITTHDTTTFVAVPLALAATAAVATILPARRALRVNPADVLRAD